MRKSACVLAAGMVLSFSGCGRQAVRPAPAPSMKSGTARSAPAPEKPKAKPGPIAAQSVKPAPAAAKPAAKPVVKPVAKPVAKLAAKPATRPAVKAPNKKPVRPVRVDSLRLEAAFFREHSSAPLAWVLARRSGNPLVADRAAAAVLYESERLNLSASFLAAVLMVENTPMDPTAESNAGAIGLMQVMPVHSGGWGCPGDLEGVEVNICHGARLLNMHLRRSRTVEMALRRYNGCMGSLVTRSCLRYPARVLRTASRIRREVLSSPVEAIEAAEPQVEAPPPLLRRAPEAAEPETAPSTLQWPVASGSP